jgi:hypothetical protein
VLFSFFFFFFFWLNKANARGDGIHQDNYPEFLAKKYFVNVPWFFSLGYKIFSPLVSKRTLSKFIVKSSGTDLQPLIPVALLPISYGGFQHSPATEKPAESGDADATAAKSAPNVPESIKAVPGKLISLSSKGVHSAPIIAKDSSSLIVETNNIHGHTGLELSLVVPGKPEADGKGESKGTSVHESTVPPGHAIVTIPIPVDHKDSELTLRISNTEGGWFSGSKAIAVRFVTVA